MKISDRTRKILKNFAIISNQLIVEPGKRLATCEYGDNSVHIQARVEETFEIPFAIGDLNQFLSVLSMVDQPVLTFMEKYVIIQSDTNAARRIDYLFTERLILRQMAKDLGKIKDPEVEIKINKQTLSEFQNAAAILQAPVMRFFSVKGKAFMTASSLKKSQGHKFTNELGPVSMDFDVSIRPDFFQPIPDDYTLIFKQGRNLMAMQNEANDIYYMYAGEIAR